MYNCDGCYYEERLPQEACNVCCRDENGRMTGYVAREENESGDNNRSVCCADSDNPSTADAVPLPLHKGGLEQGHTQGARQAENETAHKTKTHFAGIIACGQADRPCYNIQYYDPVDEEWHIGFGSYDICNVHKWLKEEFEIVRPDDLPGGSRPAPTGANDLYAREALDADQTSMEENLLEQIEELQQELVVLQEKENLKQLLIEELRAATQKLTEDRDDYAAQCDAMVQHLKQVQQEKEELAARLEKETAQGSYYKQWLDDERRSRELADAKLEMVHLIFGGGGNG